MDLELPLDDVERLEMAPVDVQRRPVARLHDRLEEEEALVAVLAGSLHPRRVALDRPALARAEHDRLHRGAA